MSEFFEKLPDTKARKERAKSNRTSRKRTGKKYAQTLTVLVVAVFFICFSLSIAWPHVSSMLHSHGADDYQGEGSGEVIVTIPSGATGTDIANLLVENDVISSAGAFIEAFNREPRAASIQPGSYSLRQQMSATAALAALLSNANRADYTVTVPEGFTVKQVADRLVNVMGYNSQDVEKALADTVALGLPAEAGGHLEGWIAPLTYTFDATTTAQEALRQMVSERVNELSKSGIDRGQWQRILTISSIVEREVSWPQYYGQVARVIENRLVDTTQIHGRLQMDSTVLYGVGKTGGVPTQADLENNNPYNTYINAGLPPAPISNPGIDAIRASVNPPAGNWLYFVTVNLETGETKFSASLDEHNANVAQLRSWIDAHPNYGQSNSEK
ncbi:endolytic transglycosylase MltG [Trueperella sp. LYQ143]|uniref:endolytic transglycosylase MltG n=1 Tax=unclassified Trueperella TaxID=2630174 RepID=UPI00398387FF